MPAGRPSGHRKTRDDLIAAAIELFAEKGYEKASIRMITDKVGVDAALVRHYFGDKSGLFAAAVLGRIDITERIAQAIPGDADALGWRIVRAYVEIWEDSATQPILRALLRSALDSESARVRIESAIQESFVANLHQLPHQSETRLALAGSHLVGMAMARYIVRFTPLASLTVEQLVEEMGPIIQRLLSDD